jgi:hypothetical protein
MKWAKLLVLCLFLAACQDDPSAARTLVRPTRTPVATVSLSPTAEPTNTPDQPHGDHDATMWHEPDGHHHGANPEDYAELWALYLEQTNGQEIGYPWLSSVFENVYPFPMGNHEGFKFFAEDDTGCDQTERPTDKSYTCVKSYLVLKHSMGTAHHLYTRIHSQYGVFEVCTLDLTQCGLVATGGHADYGVLHNGYKREICPLPSDPLSYPYDTPAGLNRLPYRAAINTTLLPPRTDDRNIQFWNSLGPGPGQIKNYPHLPNYILGMSWSHIDSWDYLDGTDCDDPALVVTPCADGTCPLNGTAFQVFSIRLQHLPSQRPFYGFTNVNGHIDLTCTEASPICVPLVIEATVPQGDALLGRGVHQGDCAESPCLEYDDGSRLFAPGYEE